MTPSVDCADRHTRLRESVAKLARAIDAGELEPHPIELAALVLLCAEHGLLVETARVQRWLRGTW